MSGVRLHGLLASTAIALLLSAGGGALAQSTASPDNGAAVSAPDAAKDTPAGDNQADKASGAAPAASATPQPDQAQTPAPAAAPTETVDATIADQLHQLASGKFDHLLGGKPQRTEIEAFYSAHNYAPLWITDGHANDRAKAAIQYLGHVDCGRPRTGRLSGAGFQIG